ncbi:MAG TPA: ABC transporter permease [Acidimicrobiales bacterium]|nr:ABC transporter permease [Acidimicrobiales bacterium]
MALLSGLALSLSMAATADARRAGSALSRARDQGNAADVVVHADQASMGLEDSEAYLDAVAALPGVESAARLDGVSLAEVNDDGSLAERLYFSSALGKLADQRAVDTVEKLDLREGRMPAPDRADEVVVTPKTLSVTGWRVGEVVTSLRVFRLDEFTEDLNPDPAKGTPLTLTIVGVGERPHQLLGEEASRYPQIYLFPAFAVQFPDSTYYISNYIRIDGGKAAVAEFRDDVREIAATYPDSQFLFDSMHDGYAEVQDALRPQLVAVWLLAGVLFIAGLLLAAQAIGRQIVANNRDLSDLRALGMTPHELGWLGVLQGWTVSTAAAVVALVVAWLSSAFTPLGTTHDFEPEPGLRFDATTLVFGSVLIALALAVTSYASARRLAGGAASRGVASADAALRDRPSRVVSAFSRAGLPPTMVTGARFALQPGIGRSATPVRSVLASVVLATTVLVVVMAFSADLKHLVDTPRQYGWDWDVAAVNDFGSIPDEAVDEVTALPEVGALAGFSQGSLRVGGLSVAAVGIDQITGTVFPTLIEGRVPQSEDDIVLGRLTMDDIDASIGDRIEVGTDDGVTTMTIVGVATFPALGATSLSETSLGDGAATVASVLPPSDGQGKYNGIFIRLDPSNDRDEAMNSLREYFAELGCADSECFLTDSRPGRLSGYAKLGALWVPFAIVLGVLLVISLSHGIATATRARRRDLAILSALGMRRSQTGLIVVWQAITTVSLAVVIALPVGIVGASIGWRFFTDRFGIRPPISVPVAQLVLLVLAGLVSAIVVGLAFVPNARRVRTIDGLVAE